jgi:peroxiredoxin
MTIKVNDCFPLVSFYQLIDGGPKLIKSNDLFNKKKIILVGVPGAFTPTCHNDHLPGYIKNYKKFCDKGMSSWVNSLGKTDINHLSDCLNEFRDSSGLKIDLTSVGLGNRLSRFAIVIDNGLIKNIFDEKGGGLEISKAENVLNNL